MQILGCYYGGTFLPVAYCYAARLNHAINRKTFIQCLYYFQRRNTSAFGLNFFFFSGADGIAVPPVSIAPGLRQNSEMLRRHTLLSANETVSRLGTYFRSLSGLSRIRLFQLATSLHDLNFNMQLPSSPSRHVLFPKWQFFY